MSPFGQQFWATVAGGGLLLPFGIVVVYLLITHWFNADLERHKAKLELANETELAATQSALRVDAERVLQSHKAALDADNARAIEQLKAELHTAATDRQIRFSRLHERRMTIIAKLFSRLHSMIGATEAYAQVIGAAKRQDERETNAFNHLQKVFVSSSNYFRRTRIYLPEHLAEQIKSFDEWLYNHSVGFMLSGSPDRPSAAAAWHQRWVDMTSETKPLLASLENEFRKMLGVDAK